jgi:hypothetical protein
MEERKTERVVVPYFEKGVLKEKEFEIKFISNSVNRDYQKLVADVYKVGEQWRIIKNLNTEMLELDFENKDELKKNTDRIKDDLKKAEDILLKYNDNMFFEKRVELIKRILIGNGYNDDLFTSIEFWDDMVEPNDLISFLSRVVHKDAELLKKKAVMNR